MNVRFDLEPADTLVVHLREGGVETTVSVAPAHAGIRSLWRALGDAIEHGYGECFWPGLSGGQYWWMFKREAETLETIAMWTRGGAAPWQHVFRAADEVTYVRARLAREIERLGPAAALE